MKIGSTGLLLLSVIWIAVSLLWFLWIKSTAVGMIWLCIGIIALIAAFLRRRTESR